MTKDKEFFVFWFFGFLVFVDFGDRPKAVDLNREVYRS